jgi:hypothetical protein
MAWKLRAEEMTMRVLLLLAATLLSTAVAPAMTVDIHQRGTGLTSRCCRPCRL